VPPVATLLDFEAPLPRTANRIKGFRLVVERSIFADLNEGTEPGIPDGLKIDSIGRFIAPGQAASG
jgi:hypothetical protein